MAIIEVNNLSKKYYLGERMSQRSILDSLKTTAKMPYRLARTLFTGESNRREEFWALKDVSFKVEEGEVLGIIGRNGAGKSTLLKILSRIVAPTEGEVIMNGRVGSLLEVGTGFHPELTGRENIFMNGSLLGMSHAEISKHFDEIVDFSGIEKFLDTPVKFYSSGMYTRLAFSVAAHLRTEILIVDEVLAVGDSEFQKKCLAKMDSVAKSGRTILFVSHNMNAVRELCSQGIILSQGSCSNKDNIDMALNMYSSIDISEGTALSCRKDRQGNGLFNFTSVKFRDGSNNVIDEAITGQELRIEIHYSYQQELDWQNLFLGLTFTDKMQNRLITLLSDELEWNASKLRDKEVFIVTITQLSLRPGVYNLNLFSSSPDTSPNNFCDVIDNVTRLKVVNCKQSFRDYKFGVIQRATLN